jgi:cobalt-zinc-cadmium efflux system outer membrane protein
MMGSNATPRRLLLCLTLLTSLSIAQETTLDLRKALERAQEANLELRAAKQQRAIAISGITTAKQIPNPTLTASGTQDVPHASVVWDQPIELAGKRGKRIAVAREEQQATELDIAALSRQIRRRTREAFFRALVQRAQTEQSKSALDLATRTKDVAQARYEAGDVAQLDVIQADAELARADADYHLAEQLKKTSDAQLAALLNLKVDQPPPVRGRAEEMPPLPSLADVTDTALKSNSDLVRTSQDLRTEERRLTLARSARIPNVDVQAGVDLDNPPDFQIGPRGQIAVQVPLFYRAQGEIQLSNARIELLRLTLESQRTNTAATVTAAFYDFEAKRRQAEQYRDRIVPENVKLADMANDSYQSGKTNLLTLIDAQRRLNDVQKAYLDSLLAAQSSFALLEEAVGAPLD